MVAGEQPTILAHPLGSKPFPLMVILGQDAEYRCATTTLEVFFSIFTNGILHLRQHLDMRVRSVLNQQIGQTKKIRQRIYIYIYKTTSINCCSSFFHTFDINVSVEKQSESSVLSQSFLPSRVRLKGHQTLLPTLEAFPLQKINRN